MDQTKFEAFAREGYNRIPIVKEVLADLDTPLSVYLKLADGSHSYLLESVQGGEKWGRYSIIGLPGQTVFKVYNHRVVVTENDEIIQDERVDDPLVAVEEFYSRFKIAPVPELNILPRFSGGLVGYFGYDTVRYVEPCLGECPNPDPLNVPDIMLMVSDEVIVFDTLAGKLYVIVHANVEKDDAYAKARRRLDDIVVGLRNNSFSALRSNFGRYGEKIPRLREIDEDDFVSGFTREGFEDAVNKIKNYIIDGDCMQVVPSQRMTIDYTAAPIELYRALRFTNPSPYMYFLNMGDFHIVGSSPEILVREEDGIATVRPIAGTRKRGKSEEEDRLLEKDLLSDPKELAEHLMLIDLGRNDIGRVAEVGSVKVTEKMVIERYSHVMHIVSNVQGRLRSGMGPIDVLRATFPAGTLTGAPKIRAMEIIDELEPVKRGVYGGAVGYLSWSGNMDTAIAIRTAIIKDNQLHIQAGAGIVYDSVPEMEWQETLNKGRAIFTAVALVEQGLDNQLEKESC